MSQIFISHVEEDRQITVALAHELEREGYGTWYYEAHSVLGVSYLEQILRAIERCTVMIVVISHHGLKSRQMDIEILRAHEENKPFIPLLQDLSYAELQKQRPVWTALMAPAVASPIGSVMADLIPHLVNALGELGVKPPKAQAEGAGPVSHGTALAETSPSYPPTSSSAHSARANAMRRAALRLAHKFRPGARVGRWRVAIGGILIVVVVLLAANAWRQQPGPKSVKTTNGPSPKDPDICIVSAEASPDSGASPLGVEFYVDESCAGASKECNEVCKGRLVYKWDFGDGTQSNGSSARHTYTRAGTYTAEVTVTRPGRWTTADAIDVFVE